MKTLIELYDERPIENVLATEMFRPEETVLVCPPEIAGNHAFRRALKTYFARRGCQVRLSFVSASLLDAVKVEKTLRRVLDTREDCAIDISGGGDAALFAAGAISGDIPVFTYSRRKNAFFEIKNAPFARNLPCTVRLDAESCFLMAGGTLLPGREDNQELPRRLAEIDTLFRIYAAHRRVWNRQIGYIQRLSAADSLAARGKRTGRGENGIVTADESLLRDFADAGLILDLHVDGEEVSFRFPDAMTRFWLRDMGSVLELQVYRACLAAGCFDDVILSAVVQWNADANKRNAVTNEIDVMAVRGVQPVFISCKTAEIKTEALNELAILRDRFGGKGSRAVIVTSAPEAKGRLQMRRRAAELDIEVIDWNDLKLNRLIPRLRKGPA
ncbi:MAG: hypothetical protein K5919_04465 [Clostridiales bacterium]|nr:hypothetical protein [Clostridiales bacterium]